jgi:hypothetical protein
VDAGNDDLRTQLETAFKEAKEEPVADTTTKAVDTSAAETQAKADRARDEAGRFAKEQKAAADAKTTDTSIVKADTKTEVVKTDVAKTEVKAETTKVPAPPNGWSAEAKAKWHALDPDVMAAVAAREQELGRAAGKMDEERAVGRDFQKIFQPYMPILQAEGTTPQQAVSSLLNTAYILRQGSPAQKRAALLDTAKQFGIDITPDTNSSTATNANPELAAVRQELAQLKGYLSSRDAQMQGASEAQIKQEIDAFSADPANAHYNEVKADMAALLSGGRAPDLKTAYDMACWARPDIRTSILAQQRAEEELKRKESEKQRADEARRKGISITGAPGQTNGKAGGEKSLREELEANMAAARSAV